VLKAKPQVLRVLVDVDVEIAEGLSTEDQGTAADQWTALVNMYNRSVCASDIAAITGYDGQLITFHFSGSTAEEPDIGNRGSVGKSG